MLTHGDSCRRLGHYNEAEELYVKALEARRRLLGEEHFKTLVVMIHLGSLYVELERYDEAEQLLVPALETKRRIYGEADMVTLEIMNAIGKLRRDQKLYEQAEELLIEVLDSRRIKWAANTDVRLNLYTNLVCFIYNRLATMAQSDY